MYADMWQEEKNGQRGKERLGREKENHTVGQQIKINSSQCWGDERGSNDISSPPPHFFPPKYSWGRWRQGGDPALTSLLQLIRCSPKALHWHQGSVEITPLVTAHPQLEIFYSFALLKRQLSSSVGQRRFGEDKYSALFLFKCYVCTP